MDEVGLDLGPALVGQPGEDRHAPRLPTTFRASLTSCGRPMQTTATSAPNPPVASATTAARSSSSGRRSPRAELGSRLPPQGGRVGDDHRPGAADHGELQVEQPDRPGTEDDDDVADLDAVMIDAVEAAGQQLSQREYSGATPAGAGTSRPARTPTTPGSPSTRRGRRRRRADHPGRLAEVPTPVWQYRQHCRRRSG